MSFNVDLQRFIKRTGLEMEAVVRTIAFDAYKMVTEKTPVDTGRARGNWNVSVGSIDSSIQINGYGKSKGNYINSSVPPNNPKAKPLNLKKGDGLKPIYITNSLPYIRKLEHGIIGKGGSRQAPNGMVMITLNELKNLLK